MSKKVVLHPKIHKIVSLTLMSLQFINDLVYQRHLNVWHWHLIAIMAIRCH